MSVNKVILIGHVGADPEVRHPDKGTIVATFSLATSETNSNNGTQTTDWHRIVLLGPRAEFAEKYIRKGSFLYLEGKIKYREYEDKFKIRRKITEIFPDKIELLGRVQK